MQRLLKHSVIFVGVFIGFVILVNLTIHLLTMSYRFNTMETAPNAEVVLIPGLLDAKTPAPIFIDRANIAIALYKADKVSKILVSGDNSTASHDEVNPMRTYLLAQGIPASDIFLDHAGLTTYDSMYRAQTIFGVTSMLIASQSYHLPRAVFIARALGINAYGVNADEGHILSSNYVREIFADEKAVFDILFHVRPALMGPTIPITGDGSQYP